MYLRSYKAYLLTVLTTILVFNYVDRLALGVLLEDIKADLSLSDTQLGFLGGLSFAVFYSLMGIPIARWADRGNRILIISLTTLLWSVAVAASGFAVSFTMLVLIRIGVAVGEAGCLPPAYSLIADHFSRAERPRAVAIYGMGGGIAFVIGYFLAGWLNDAYGWRVTFMWLGLPGLVLGALAWFTLKEPRNERRSTESIAPPIRAAEPSFAHVCVTLWSIPTFRHLLFCLSVSFFFMYGMLQWQPAFFMRSYGLEASEVGTWLTVTYLLSTIAGTYVAGELATRYAPNNEPLQLRCMSLAVIAAGVLSVFVYLSPSATWAFIWLGLASVGQTTLSGPLFSTIQTIVPENMRAMSFAILYLFANLIGMGFGPLSAGMLSDAFRPWAAEESLRYASMVLAPGYIWVAWYSWQASKTVKADLLRAQADANEQAIRSIATAQPGKASAFQASSW